jgi:WD40 repeat protein
LRGHTSGVYFVAFSPDGQKIVSLSRDLDVCVWDTATGALVSGPSKQHAEGVLAAIFMPVSTYCALSSNGKWIAGGPGTFAFGPLQVFDSKTGLLVAEFDHTAIIDSVTFSPDSKRVLVTYDDGIIQVYNIG